MSNNIKFLQSKVKWQLILSFLICFLILVLTIIFGLRLHRLENPVTPSVAVVSYPDFSDILVHSGLNLECANYSQKDVLKYNLTCEYRLTNGMVAILSLSDVFFNSCEYVNMNSNNGLSEFKLLNISVSTSKENDKCLEYKVVSIKQDVKDIHTNINTIYIS